MVLHRPVELAAQIGQVLIRKFHMSDNATSEELRSDSVLLRQNDGKDAEYHC